MRVQEEGLPYINNARAVLITVAINLASTFAFNFPQGIAFQEILWEAPVFGAVTTAIDMAIIYPQLKKKRARGLLPVYEPGNRMMQKLPRHPAWLGLVYAVAFAALSLLANWAILSFFGIDRMTFAEWAVYEITFVTLLSVKIVEYIIFRFVQPDWADAHSGAPMHMVRNPLPRFAMFKAVYASVTGNMALNIIIGTILGGVVLMDSKAVVIYPTTIERIHITGIVFGMISGLLVSNGVIKAVNQGTHDTPLSDRPKSAAKPLWLPRNRAALTGVVCCANVVITAAVLRGVMALFNLPMLDFYRYTVLMTAYATVNGKLISRFLIWRCTRLDYAQYIWRREEA